MGLTVSASVIIGCLILSLVLLATYYSKRMHLYKAISRSPALPGKLSITTDAASRSGLRGAGAGNGQQSVGVGVGAFESDVQISSGISLDASAMDLPEGPGTRLLQPGGLSDARTLDIK